MYTQCPQCQTTFRVTATMLKAARGKVRCGRCTHVFNALTFLIDDAEPGSRPPADTQVERSQPSAHPGPPSAAPQATASPQATSAVEAQATRTHSAPAKAQRTPASEKRYDDNTPFEEDDEELQAEPPGQEARAEDSVAAIAPSEQQPGPGEAEPENIELVDGAAEDIVLASGSEAAGELLDESADEQLEQLLLEQAGESPIDEELTLEQAGADEEGTEASIDALQMDSPANEERQEEVAPGEELQVDAADGELQPESAEGAEDVLDSALEFTADDLKQVFVEAPAGGHQRPTEGATGDETAEHEILDVDMETPASPEVITLEGDTVVLVNGEEEPSAPSTELQAEAAPPRKPRTQEAIDLEVRREIEKAFADDPTTRAEFILPSGKKVSLHRNQDEVEVEEVDEAAEALERATSLQRRKRIAWGAGGVVLAILLGLQVVHYNRQALVQSAQVGPMLASIYRAFGTELTPAWKVDAYDVRQWGAAADPRSGTVRVRASVTNGAEHAQPYPLLRLTLLNRFGERLRQSDIEPKDYLTRAPGSGQLLGAGQRVDASIAIVDPGDDAVNFEIDVCLRRNAAVTCANDALRQRS